ncbi:MAG: PqqD family protein [Thermodesulfobacteriota bacterium]|nr:PqqD family protein [Thermodesulfobacteriota bacterium]
MKIGYDQIFQQNIDGIFFIELDDGCILYKESDEVIYSLNNTAAFIWILLDGKRTVSNVTDALQQSFDVKYADLSTVVGNTIAELLKDNLIKRCI